MAILVAVADDDLRGEVYQTAVELGEGLGEGLHVVHLVGERTAEADATRLRDELRDRANGEGVVSTVSVEHIHEWRGRSRTRVAKALLELAADVEVTHIVMGHHTRGLVDRLAGGSATYTVADEAAVPVTVVPEG